MQIIPSEAIDAERIAEVGHYHRASPDTMRLWSASGARPLLPLVMAVYCCQRCSRSAEPHPNRCRARSLPQTTLGTFMYGRWLCHCYPIINPITGGPT